MIRPPSEIINKNEKETKEINGSDFSETIPDALDNKISSALVTSGEIRVELSSVPIPLSSRAEDNTPNVRSLLEASVSNAQPLIEAGRPSTEAGAPNAKPPTELGPPDIQAATEVGEPKIPPSIQLVPPNISPSIQLVAPSIPPAIEACIATNIQPPSEEGLKNAQSATEAVQTPAPHNIHPSPLEPIFDFTATYPRADPDGEALLRMLDQPTPASITSWPSFTYGLGDLLHTARPVSSISLESIFQPWNSVDERAQDYQRKASEGLPPRTETVTSPVATTEIRSTFSSSSVEVATKSAEVGTKSTFPGPSAAKSSFPSPSAQAASKSVSNPIVDPTIPASECLFYRTQPLRHSRLLPTRPPLPISHPPHVHSNTTNIIPRPIPPTLNSITTPVPIPSPSALHPPSPQTNHDLTKYHNSRQPKPIPSHHHHHPITAQKPLAVQQPLTAHRPAQITPVKSASFSPKTTLSSVIHSCPWQLACPHEPSKCGMIHGKWARQYDPAPAAVAARRWACPLNSMSLHLQMTGQHGSVGWRCPYGMRCNLQHYDKLREPLTADAIERILSMHTR